MTGLAASGEVTYGLPVVGRAANRRPAWRLVVLALPACLAMAALSDARGQTIGSLAVTGSAAQMTVDGLTFAVSDCTVALCNDVELRAVSSTGGATIEVLGNGQGSNGSDILINADGPGWDRFGFTVTVSGAGATKISSVSSTVSGNTSSGGKIDAHLALSKTGTCTASGGYDHCHGCAPLALGGDRSMADFSPVSSLSVRYDLGAYAATGQTIILSNATQTFTPAPEPATIGLMAAGMAGLGIARMRQKPPPRSANTSD
jgi:hypothetical protein